MIGVAAAVVVVCAYVWWSNRPTPRATLRVVDALGKPVLRGKLELFELIESGAARSPSRKLGELPFTAEQPVRLASDVMPEQTVVRVTAEGHGASFAVLRGESHETVTLAAPIEIVGEVVGASGETLPGVRVVAFGGGRYGVALGEASSGSEGTFRIGGIAGNLPVLLLRAIHPGYAVCEVDYDRRSGGAASGAAVGAASGAAKCKLQATELVSGLVVVPKGVAAEGLVIQAHDVLGATATTDPQGAFVLDHLPRGMTPRLLVTSLPEGYTHRATPARAGQSGVEIVVTKACTALGTVVEAGSGQLVTFATVAHDHGPRGRETFSLDPLGRWKLVNVPEGETVLEAYLNLHDRAAKPDGTVTVNLQNGEVRENVVIPLTR